MYLTKQFQQKNFCRKFMTSRFQCMQFSKCYSQIRSCFNKTNLCFQLKLVRCTIGIYIPSHVRFYSLRSFRGMDPVKFPRLTPQHVTAILQANETSVEEVGGAVKGFETNQLQSNNPMEDRRAEAKLITGDKGPQYLFGIYDGHAGHGCAQSLKERLFNYLAVTMSTPEQLQRIKNVEMNFEREMLQYYQSCLDYKNPNLFSVQEMSLARFASEALAVYDEEETLTEKITNAFVRLAQDISMEALPAENSSSNPHCLSSAFSGAVGCVAFLNGLDLYIANVGDSRAVLGVKSRERSWKALPLSDLHNAENVNEVNRLLRHHPNESANILKNGRLFGDLAPLRAFGDVRYKWAAKDLKHIANTVRSPQSAISVYGNRLVPRNYNTPPYLTAEPEIFHHRLRPKDKFLVLASDGLWDVLSPEKVVQLVAGHFDGQQVLVNFNPPGGASLKNINEMLVRRKTSLANITVDTNVSTHLIRNCLGPEHGHISAQLTLPDSIVRFYRDDISITVIYFDSDYVIEKSVL